MFFIEKKLFEIEQELFLRDQQLSSQTTLLSSQNTTITAQITELILLREKVRVLLLRLYGSKSEKLAQHPGVFDEGEDGDKLADDIDIQIDNMDTGVDDEENKDQKKSDKKKSKAGRKGISSTLPRREIVIYPNEEDMICPECDTRKSSMGEATTETVSFVPAHLEVIRVIRKTCVCKKCEEGIVKPPALIPRAVPCIAEPSLLAHILVAKYLDHLPLYRQEKILNRLGIAIPRATLCNWVHKTAEALDPLYQCIKEQIVASNYVQADETTVQVLKEKDRKAQQKSYMWIYRSGAGKFIFYEYNPHRNKEIPYTVLKDFKGYLQTDGYSGYDYICKKNNLVRVKCMAHARRKFVEITKLVKNKKKGISHQIVVLIGKLYLIEKKCTEKKLSYENIYKLRQANSKPVMEDIHKLINDNVSRATTGSLLYKAMHYFINHYEDLSNYLSHGMLKIDNNGAERSIKAFATGRKNWLFSGNPKGAKSSAIIYTVLQTAKEHNVNEEEYLAWVLKKLEKKQKMCNLLPAQFIKHLESNMISQNMPA